MICRQSQGSLSQPLSRTILLSLALSRNFQSRASAFSPFPSLLSWTTHNLHPSTQAHHYQTTTCHAKLNKIASTFDLDEILSNEKEFAEADGSSVSPPLRKGRRAPAKSMKKKAMKEQLEKQKMEKQKFERQKNGLQIGTEWQNDDGDDEIDESGVDYETLLQSIDFLAYKVPPSLEGKRVDAALVELLNEDADNNDVAISRSQCGTLLSNECVFVIPPDAVSAFQSSSEADAQTTMSYISFHEFGEPVQRKSQLLEASSILIYPSRASLLSPTSSAMSLLSNSIPPTEILPQKFPLDILYEDECMIVINKAAGMVVHPAAGNWDGTVVNALSYYLMNESPHGAGDFFSKGKGLSEETGGVDGDTEINQDDSVTNSLQTLRPGIVHRLDKGTTGVLVVAKTRAALATLSEAFAERRVKKQYVAVAIGNPGDDIWINKPIGRHPQHRQKMRVVPDPSGSMPGQQPRLTGPRSPSATKQGRNALSHIHTVRYDGKLSIVEVKIATGRTHQIRVHLQDHGTPIYGDDVYGLSDWNKALSARRGITRPLLHAQRLEIEHPITGEVKVFQANVADDMKGVIDAIAMGAVMPAGEKVEDLMFYED